MSDFTALYEQYGPDVFRFALYLTSDPTKADDITAETFFRAWTTGSRLRMATVKGYLITIARNVYLQQLRDERRRESCRRTSPMLPPVRHGKWKTVPSSSRSCATCAVCLKRLD